MFDQWIRKCLEKPTVHGPLLKVAHFTNKHMVLVAVSWKYGQNLPWRLRLSSFPLSLASCSFFSWDATGDESNDGQSTWSQRNQNIIKSDLCSNVHLLYGYNSTRALIGCWAGIIRDLKHHDGSHHDGIPEANFLFRSCVETEQLIAICRRLHVGDATFTVLT